jgi:hypothetical protein
MKNTINAFSIRSWMYRGGLIGAFSGFLFSASTLQNQAQTFNLDVQDTAVQVNLAGGISSWTLNGINELSQQWFYYSVGGSPVNSIDTISPWSSPTLGGQVVLGTLVNTNLTETYANSTLSVKTKYTLGENSSGATFSTAITLENVSSTSQTFNFYQYSHFGLGGSSSGQNVQFLGTTSPYEVTQNGNGAFLTGTLTALAGGSPSTAEEIAGVYDGTQFGLENGDAAPSFTDTSLSATGNVDFGYEFTATLAPGTSLSISEIQSVPEPTSLALISAGLFGVGLVRKSASRFSKKQ